MPNTALPTLTFYEPKYYQKLSPTFHDWVRLNAADVHALEEWPDRCPAQDVYFYLNHPIKWIRLVGVIVDFEAYEKRIVMVLDDSSGANIEITCSRLLPNSRDKPGKDENHTQKDHRVIGRTKEGYDVELTGVDVGSVVRVKGGIGSFRGEKQMTLERLEFVRTTNDEAKAWAQNAAYRRDILSKPWVMSDEDRMKFEHYERHERRQQQRFERERQRRLERGLGRRSERKERQARRDGNGRRVKVIRGEQSREERKHRTEDGGRHGTIRKAAKA